MRINKNKPPFVAEKILNLISDHDDDLSCVGDFGEEFLEIAESKSILTAKSWYWKQFFISVPKIIRESIYRSFMMFRNYLKITFRNLKTNRGHTFINIFGFSIGMAASILIFLYVQKEFSYDMFHEKAGRVCKVLLIDKSFGTNQTPAGITWAALSPVLKQEIPEVTESVRIWRRGRVPMTVEDRKVFSTDFAFVDPEIFKIFDFKLEVGDENTALAEPFKAVITRNMAQKLFGDSDPVGKQFINQGIPITVSGVLEDIPENSHMKFDVMVSLLTPDTTSGFGARLRSWNWIAFPTYLLLNDPSSKQYLEEKMIEVIRNNGVSESFSVTFQPLKDVHLHSRNIIFDSNNINKGDAGYVYSLMAVSILIIFIAAFNFMNLATARSLTRAKEVGLRKVAGARKRQLIYQFLGESLFLCFVSFSVALFIVALVNIYISSNYSIDLSIWNLLKPGTLMGMIGFLSLLGIFAGSYPALVLSGFNPVTVLKGSFHSSSKGAFTRKLLVLVQFSISIALILASSIVYQQIHFIKTMNMGYDRDQVLNITLNNDIVNNGNTFTGRLMDHPSIVSVSSGSNSPIQIYNRSSILPEGKSRDEAWVTSILNADEHYFDTMDISIVKGRNFSSEHSTDVSNAVILNETAVRAIGWDDPIGKTVSFGGPNQLEVIGVIRDFHFSSIRQKIESLTVRFRPENNSELMIKVKGGEISEAMAYIENAWTEVFPNDPFEYSFLDEQFDSMYRNESDFEIIVRTFTFLAILIACLGLYGLASHMVEQRTKIIGIQKVLGATVSGIIIRISTEFLNLVVVSNIIAWPVAYFVMNGWLEDFVYKVDMDWSIFVLSGFAVLVITLLTVFHQAFRVARANPVESLRYE
ncbi:MAG: FtsX-like permease family protein [bacterium]|nr:FtsX-like permease family protein [bacterium]